jgi:hypothetical protein
MMLLAPRKLLLLRLLQYLATLNGEEASRARWTSVFQQHPEFFLFEGNGDAALKWRHAYPRAYDPRKHIDYTPEQVEQLSIDESGVLHRRPLSAEQVDALMNVAIELHAREG